MGAYLYQEEEEPKSGPNNEFAQYSLNFIKDGVSSNINGPENDAHSLYYYNKKLK